MKLDSWDWVLLAMAGYVATIGLVRLMLAKREQVVTRLQADIERARRQQTVEKTPPRSRAA